MHKGLHVDPFVPVMREHFVGASSSAEADATTSKQSGPTISTFSTRRTDEMSLPIPPLPPIVIYDVDASQPVDQPVYLRSAPWRILLSDLKLIISKLGLLWVVLAPLPTVGIDLTWAGIIGQVILIIGSVILTILTIASFALGFPAPVLTTFAIYMFIQISNWIQGSNLLHSPGEKATGSEQWLFVNGIGTSSSGSQLIINRLEELFHRPIIGIHNRTQGIWFDLIECVLQRDLLYPTDDARQGYEVLSAAIRDDTKKRVVLISHSQGGIILSNWIDQLLCDFPAAQLRKIEIYTFASAANHFSAPSAIAFNNIEHFANDGDFVARIGVLSPDFAPYYDVVWQRGPVPMSPGRYAGRIFKRKDVTGHLLLSHYLAPGNSFLEHPSVTQNSQLCRYLGGNDRLE